MSNEPVSNDTQATPTIPDTSHDRIFNLLERLGVSYAQGRAVEAILEAADCETPDARAAELLQSALRRMGVPADPVGTPVGPVDNSVDNSVDKPAPQPEPAPPAKPTERPAKRRKPAPQGKGGFRAGRTCTKCGKAKGATGFPKGGGDVCRLCLGDNPGQPGQPGKRPGKHQQPGVTRVCAKCGERKSFLAFPAGGDTCRLCLGDNPEAAPRGVTVTGKRCKRCGEMRPLAAFPDGAEKCRSCASVHVVKGSAIGHGADGGA